jgi:hypothetical protein
MKVTRQHQTLPSIRKGPCLTISFAFILSFFILLRGIIQPSFDATVAFSSQNSNEKIPAIPNIVHYVHIIPPSSPDIVGEHASIEFEFRHFISIYSAYLYVQPKKIYIHTNAAAHIVQQARQSSNQWTYAIANLPTVEFHYEVAPTQNSVGVPIVKLANQGDFIRTRVLITWGGIYLDEDVYLLKDLSELRHAGFHNVVGSQEGGAICPGMILSAPGNDLITAYHDLQDTVFDGAWSTHSVDLLTRLVSEFATRNQQVLVLEQDAFFPFDWEPKGVGEIYQVHEPDEEEKWLQSNDTRPFNLTTFINSFQLYPPKTWRKDWRVSYAIHGWNNNIHIGDEIFGEFGGITLKYVLAKSSNFARAVYPAIKNALDEGVIRVDLLN